MLHALNESTNELCRCCKNADRNDLDPIRKMPCRGFRPESLASALLYVALKHCEAIRSLVAEQNLASAFALMRPLMETTYRAMWIHRCASSEQVRKCMETDQWHSAWKLVTEVETTNGYPPLLSKVWSDSREIMHSYTHGGTQTAFRHFAEDGFISPTASEQEIFEVVRITGIFSFSIFSELVDMSQGEDLSSEVEAMSERLWDWAFNNAICAKGV